MNVNMKRDRIVMIIIMIVATMCITRVSCDNDISTRESPALSVEVSSDERKDFVDIGDDDDDDEDDDDDDDDDSDDDDDETYDDDDDDDSEDDDDDDDDDTADNDIMNVTMASTRVELPPLPIPHDSIDISKTVEVTVPTTEQFMTAIEIIRHMSSAPTTTSSSDSDDDQTSGKNVDKWIRARGECTMAAYISIASLLRDPLDNENQDDVFDDLARCKQHAQLQTLAYQLLQRAVQMANTTLQLPTNEMIMKAMVEKQYNDSRVVDGIANLHYWLGVSLMTTGEEHSDNAWMHFDWTMLLAAGDYHYWPVYCVKWRRLSESFTDLSEGRVAEARQRVQARDTWFFNHWGREMLALHDGVRNASVSNDTNRLWRWRSLRALILEYRALECSSDFVRKQFDDWNSFRSMSNPQQYDIPLTSERAHTPYDALAHHHITTMNSIPSLLYGTTSFQYGTFFLNGFDLLARDRRLQPYFHELSQTQTRRKFYHLGSNVGNEAFYGGLGYNLPTIGVEILCNLVDIANDALAKYAPEADIEFVCADVMSVNMSDACLLYLDSEIWDEKLQDAIEAKLLRELRPPAAVITPHKFNITANPSWTYQGEALDAGQATSWQTIFYIYTNS